MTDQQHKGNGGGNGNGNGRSKWCGQGGLISATKDLKYTDKTGRVFKVRNVRALECPHCGRLSFTLEMADHYGRKIHQAIAESAYARVSG